MANPSKKQLETNAVTYHWWMKWLFPKTVLAENNMNLIAGWVDRENDYCYSTIRRVALISGLIQLIFFYLDSFRPEFSWEFSSVHRGLSLFLFLSTFILIQFRLAHSLRYGFYLYKLSFIFAATVLVGFQMALMFRIASIPRSYPAAILVIIIATSGIGPINTVLLSLIHLVMLVAIGGSWYATHPGFFISDVSLQLIAAVLTFMISSRYTLHSRIFVADWREKNHMSVMVQLAKNWGEHAFSELTKLVYPHMVEAIHVGKLLEDTMPIGQATACTIAFDIVGSSGIKHPQFATQVERFLITCFHAMNKSYDGKLLENDAYRIKDLGDGFLCSVGFPFQTPKGEEPADVAVSLALKFTAIFRECMDELNLPIPVNCSIGIALGSVEGYFPSGGIKQYDLRGNGLVLATRYEALRKQLMPAECRFCDLLTISKAVYERLSPRNQRLFEGLDLNERNLAIRDDKEAKVAYLKKDQVPVRMKRAA